MTEALHTAVAVTQTLAFLLASFAITMLIKMHIRGINTPNDIERWKDYMIVAITSIFSIVFFKLSGI